MSHERIQQAARLLVKPAGALVPFMGHEQRAVLLENLSGEEAEYFVDLLIGLQERITAMPVTHQTDGQGKDAIAYLHYFGGSFDAYITEKDVDGEQGQHQAYGYASFGDGFEAGYVSIAELILNNAELDLHFTPKPIKECITC